VPAKQHHGCPDHLTLQKRYLAPSDACSNAWVYSHRCIVRRDRGGNQSSSLLPGEHGHGQIVRQSRRPKRFQYSAQGRDPGGRRQSSARVTALAASTSSGPSVLQLATSRCMQSKERAQQWDPLGPLYFCLAIIELLKSMKSELVLAYLDDITLGDEDAETVLKEFLHAAGGSCIPYRSQDQQRQV